MPNTIKISSLNHISICKIKWQSQNSNRGIIIGKNFHYSIRHSSVKFQIKLAHSKVDNFNCFSSV